ncbi:MAG: hypothetical protein IJ419_08360 [Agathobacter sp.]|nr:hypothetical protein [Agathobacter sp.]
MADKKVKLFTHDDLDGVSCGVLGQAAFGNNISIDYCTNGDINTRFRAFIDSGEYKNYDRIYITDINLDVVNAELIDTLMAEKTILLDHHPTAMFLNDYSWASVAINCPDTDIKTSATELFFEHLKDARVLDLQLPYQEFAEIVRDYDTWRWTTPEGKGQICKDYNDLMHLYGKEAFVSIAGARVQSGSLELTETDRILLDVDRRKMREYCESKSQFIMPIEVGPYLCGMVYADSYTNDMAHYMMNNNPQFDFVAVISTEGNVALRTKRDDLDLGRDVARPLGGGGHPKAAGFQFDPSITHNMIQDIFRGPEKEHVIEINRDNTHAQSLKDDGPNQDDGPTQAD